MKNYWLVSVLLIVALLLSGCGATIPSSSSGVVVTFRVLDRTIYTALIEFTVANYSSSTFYPQSVELKAQICEWGGDCVEYSEKMTVSFDSRPFYSGEVRSVRDVVSIGNLWVYIRWMEVILEGRLGGQMIRVLSNRVYF
ncbi:MAG: hypothetical protein ABDK94_00740 [Atribacterota bacterium]